MGQQLPLTDPFFATEEESNIISNDWIIPMLVDLPLPLAVAQEEARRHQETDQLALSTPHRPRWQTEDGEMVCGTLAPIPLTTPHSTQHLLPLTPMRERRRVLLEGILPFPVQATTHHGGHPYVLVCSPLRMNGGAEMVCGSALATPLSYEEKSEVVCGGVGWGRTAQSLPHQTGTTTGPSSVVWNNLAAINTRPHTTHHYVPRLIPRDTTTPNTLLAAGTNVHFSCECHSSEVECWAKRGIPTKAMKDPPSTQELVPGRMTRRNPFDND